MLTPPEPCGSQQPNIHSIKPGTAVRCWVYADRLAVPGGLLGRGCVVHPVRVARRKWGAHLLAHDSVDDEVIQVGAFGGSLHRLAVVYLVETRRR